MTIIDPTTPPAKTSRRHWLTGIFRRRSTAHLTSVSDLPPHLLYDIGVNTDFVDAMLRHRR